MSRAHWDITEGIIRCAIEVHKGWGPGLLESMYRDALVVDLQLAGFGRAG
jgi:GxxExxY protein